ncbi:NAD(P)-binding protein [Nonomuraea wenchangensis]|uniref:NAD(P)-binding protein n=1 Tax=Nonomuraea wenchangensis TaxID=568860 RepID=UPI0037167936
MGHAGRGGRRPGPGERRGGQERSDLRRRHGRGLSAAHELAERGFQVTVYERKALGGKSRSIPVPGPSSTAGSASARTGRRTWC